MSRITIKDVANKLGISATSVSLVLNDKDKKGRVSESLAEKIREVAAAMQYEPNSIAKGLRSGRSETIGLIVADISNPFFSNLAFHIQEHAEKYGYSVIITNTNEDTAKMEKMISVLKNRLVDGFIIVPTEQGEEQIEKLVANKMPLVLLDRYFQKLNASYVVVNNFNASMNATNLLLNLKCKRIAQVIYKSSLSHMEQRKGGYVEAMTKRGLYDPKLVKEINHKTIYDDIQKAIMELVCDEEKIDGLFFATNSISIIGLKILAGLNLRIPKDIKVVCFDKNDAIDLSQYPIPYIQQPVPEMGKRAVDLLMEQITKKTVSCINNELETCLAY